MKEYRSILLLCLICVVPLLGCWTGEQMSSLAQDSSGESTSVGNQTDEYQVDAASLDETDTQNNTQHNVLVIGIDSFDSNTPQLESVWLILYKENTPHFSLIPIFPIRMLQNNAVLSDDNQLINNFQVGQNRELDGRFFNYLQSQEIWWSSYIIIDKNATRDIVNYFNQLVISTGVSEANSPIEFSDIQGGPAEILKSQAKLAADLCKSAMNVSSSNGVRLSEMLETIQSNMVSSSNFSETISNWENLLTSEKEITCEFPSLANTSYHP